jgi:hypothetical protein
VIEYVTVGQLMTIGLTVKLWGFDLEAYFRKTGKQRSHWTRLPRWSSVWGRHGTAASGAEDRRTWHVTANRLLEYCVLDQSELMTRKRKYFEIES